MARIFNLQIKNYRSFQNFSFNFQGKNIICLVGRGDSGKTTILEAINAVLSPLWNLSFYDNDFYNLNTKEPIEISVTLADIPDAWKLENKFGLYLKGYDKQKNEIVENYDGELFPAIKIVLTVDETLEPRWEVVNDISGERKAISGSDRAKLNIFCIADYLDRHFSLASGSPLYSLFKQEEGILDSSALITATRQIKALLDKDDTFPELKPILKKITTNAQQMGLAIDALIPTIDSKDISIKDGKLSIHDAQKIPLRMKGKGSKRITSIAIQLATTDKKSIVLIDEIEQGLEPDRAKCLVASLKKDLNQGQTFFSSHSRDVICELQCSDIYRLNDQHQLQEFSENLQGLIRKCPEMVFAKKVILCEGATEVGFCRALNKYRTDNGLYDFSYSGIVVIDGTGSTQVDYAREILSLNIPLLWFCDSDRDDVNNQKTEIIGAGATVVDWDNNSSFEEALFKNINDQDIISILSLVTKIISEKDGIDKPEAISKIKQSVSSRFPEFENELSQEVFSAAARTALAQTANKKEWFKTVSYGEDLGSQIIPQIMQHSTDNEVYKKVKMICNWCDNV